MLLHVFQDVKQTRGMSDQFPLDTHVWTAICQILTSDTDDPSFEHAIRSFSTNIKSVVPNCFNDDNQTLGKIVNNVVRAGFERISTNSNNETVKNAENLFNDCVSDLVELTLSSWPTDQPCNDLLAEFYSTIINAGAVSTIIQSLTKYDSPPTGWITFISQLDTRFDSIKKLTVYALDNCTDSQVLNKLFGKEMVKNDALFALLIEDMILASVQPKHSPRRRSFHIARYLAQTDKLFKSFVKTSQFFCHQSRHMDTVDFNLQTQIAIAMVDFAKHMPEEFYSQTAQIVGTDLLFSMEHFMQAPTPNRRNLGLVICEAMTNLFPLKESNLNMKFEYIKDDVFVQELLKIVGGTDDDGTYPVQLVNIDAQDSEARLDDTATNGISSLHNKTEADTIELEKLVSNLRSEDVTVYFSSLIQLITACENGLLKSDQISDAALVKVISTPIRSQIPNSKVFHHRLLELFLSIRPELIAPALSTVISYNYTMDQRIAVFRGLIGAANLLATGRGFDHLGADLNEIDNDDDEDSSSIDTVDRNEREQSLIRVNPSFLKPGREDHENTFLDQAHLFILPLVKQKFEYLENHQNDPFKLNIISQIEFTAALLLILGYGSPDYVSLCRAVADFAASIRHIEDGFIQESIIFAYSAMVRGLPPLTLVEYFYDDLSDWIDHVNSFATVTKRDKSTPLAMALSVTVPVLQDALSRCMAQLTE
uniref:Mediator of RNA polymerase II transcription subunit 5 n=1 Tax=Panagrellus redivivus TaxID=6233 RepID=A0A7E4V9Z5_PANRE